jgi:hypothetical protein
VELLAEWCAGIRERVERQPCQMVTGVERSVVGELGIGQRYRAVLGADHEEPVRSDVDADPSLAAEVERA